MNENFELRKIDLRGIFGFYKPKGPSSNDFLNQIKKRVVEKKIGHAGTLDPLAEGVLVVAIGKEFTKKIAIQVKKEKEYIAEIFLGKTSTTDDEEGEKKSFFSGDGELPMIEMFQVEKVLSGFKGEIMQTPPVYSAIKINGQEAYKRARKGELVEMKARPVFISEIELLEYQWPVIKVRFVTGSGVYIRSLARDIGMELGVGGYLKKLKRTRVGEITIENCKNLEDLK